MRYLIGIKAIDRVMMQTRGSIMYLTVHGSALRAEGYVSMFKFIAQVSDFTTL